MIYRQRKPVYWSPISKTALAEAELEYNERHISRCAFVRFPLVKVPDFLKNNNDIKTSHLSALIWTTTPWTLPANKAIAVGADLDYCVIEVLSMPEFGQMVIGKDRLEHVISFLGDDVDVRIVVDEFKGRELAGKAEYTNILQGSSWSPQSILEAKFVSAASGTGLVQLAPGHGHDDFNACKDMGPFKSPVDDNGCFTEDAYPDCPGLLQGKNILREGTKAVIDLLDNPPPIKIENLDLWGSFVFATHQIEHKYPLDWRTKRPVIVRATNQWFADIESVKEQAVEALESVDFIPQSGRARLESFIRGRDYWCISRQRSWGVPIPALYRIDDGSNDVTVTKKSIDHISKALRERGTDAWWTDKEDEPAWVHPSLEGRYVRGKDTMDVWFDSGSSWTLLKRQLGNNAVADVYLEGTDQHRGWFQSSLLTYCAYYGGDNNKPRAPFKRLVTHGFTLDEFGRKMSKSLNNVVQPEEIMGGVLFPRPKEGNVPLKHSRPERKVFLKGAGTDALRLWVASNDFTNDIVISQAMLKSVHSSMQKYRVTLKWLLGVLDSFKPIRVAGEDLMLPTNNHQLLDQIALYQLASASKSVYDAYSRFEFSRAVITINKYVNHNLSAFYFEAIKDRVYAGTVQDRLSAQRVLTVILNELLLMLAPITPLLVEETFDYMSMHVRQQNVHPLHRIWEPFTTGEEEENAQSVRETEATIMIVNTVHNAIKQVQEQARSNSHVGSGLECDIHISIPEDSGPAVQKLITAENERTLAAMFVVSDVEINNRMKGEESDNRPSSAAADEGGGESRSWKYVAHFDAQSPTGQMGSVTAVPATKHKCPRCWRYASEKPDRACERCDFVLAERGTRDY